IKFEDPNGDGNLADGTVPAGGSPWTIKVFTNAATPVLVTSTTTSTVDGTYSVNLQPGSYLVCEVLQASWTQSYPANTTCSTASGVAAGGHAVIVTSSGTFANRNFGNYTTGTVSGIKFEDPNGDGNLADGTVPAGGSPWTIKVFTNAATPVLVTSTTTSTVDGTYSVNLQPGSYLVCEVLQASWTQSYPANTTCSTASGVAAGGHAVIVTSSGTFANRNFGNWASSTISGTKWHDNNANGIRDAGDNGLSGWTIYADYNGNSSLDPGEPSGTTDGTGAYSI